jgi:hypothetical protein
MQDSSLVEALVLNLREKQFGGQVAEPLNPDPTERANQLHQRLKSAAGSTPSGLEDTQRARPHLVQKLLLWEISRGTVRHPDSFTVLQSMRIPEVQSNLGAIPKVLQGAKWQTWHCCPLILLPCLAGLATRALQQHPEALEVTRANPTQVRAALVAHKDAHGVAPSLEQLFKTVFVA